MYHKKLKRIINNTNKPLFYFAILKKISKENVKFLLFAEAIQNS